MPTKKRVSFSDRQQGVDPADLQEVDDAAEEEEEDPEAASGRYGGEYLNSFSNPALRPPSLPPRVAHCSDGTPLAAATSPVRKKIAALQDRRVNTILLEALQLVDCSKEELATIEKSVKKLRDAIYGFSILVDKQVNIIGVETLEERGRIRADIQDLAEHLRHSYEVFDATCGRMRQTLSAGKQQIQLHKKRVGSCSPGRPGRAGNVSPLSSPHRRPGSQSPRSPSRKLPLNTPAPSPSVLDSGLSFSPACGRVPLLPLLECQPTEHEPAGRGCVPVYMTPEFFRSVMRSVGLDEKEFLDQRDLVRFLQEMLTFSIAKSRALTFMGKAFHRRLIPTYARDLVQMITSELQCTPTPTAVVPHNTFLDFMSQAPFRFDALLDRLYVADANQYTGEPSPVAPPMAVPAANPFSDHFSRNGGVLHDGRVVDALLVNRPDAELLETAEQTLAMAKLLHDLATAESEARHGDRISVRSPAARSGDFSRVYLATSKELLSKESGV